MSIRVEVWSAMRTSVEPAIVEVVVPAVAVLDVAAVGLSEEWDGRSTKGRFLVRFLSVIVRVGREDTRGNKGGYKEKKKKKKE